MIVYIPTSITSVEQAESLPKGTLYFDVPGEWMFRRYDNGKVEMLAEDLADGVAVTALVPVEAEEETRLHIVRSGAHTTTADLTRLVTDWAITGGPSPDRRGDCA